MNEDADSDAADDDDHAPGSEAFPPALGHLVAAELRRQGERRHAAAEALIAYHEGRLEGPETEELRDHLAVCPECARLLLDLPAFLAAPPSAAATGATAAAAATDDDDRNDDSSWELLRRALPGPGPRPAAAPPPPQQRLSPVLLAAAVLLAVLTAFVWLLVGRFATPSAPGFVELTAADVLRGTGAGSAGVLPPATLHARAATTLVLHLARPQQDLRAAVELWGAPGRAAGRGPGDNLAAAPPPRPLDAPFKVPSAGVVVVVLRPGQLAPGSYELWIVDPAQPAAEPLGRYPIEVVP